jgi:hypothetical protein
MKAQITNRLNTIEAENDVTVLYACESGSRAWGFDNSKSDYDVRFIYKRNDARDYLSLSERSEVIEMMDGDLDIVGWDIKKALYLHYRSNPNLREWIVSPIVYLDWKIDVFKGLPDFDSGVLKYHYLNIVKSNWRRLCGDDLVLSKRVIKMYMYNCRCILAWKVLDEGDSPSINIFDLLDQAKGLDEGVRQDIEYLISYYKGNCEDDLDFESIERISQWMARCLEVMRKDFPKKEGKSDLKSYDERFFDIVFPNFEEYMKRQE